jgi:hypothetical protein
LPVEEGGADEAPFLGVVLDDAAVVVGIGVVVIVIGDVVVAIVAEAVGDEGAFFRGEEGGGAGEVVDEEVGADGEDYCENSFEDEAASTSIPSRRLGTEVEWELTSNASRRDHRHRP